MSRDASSTNRNHTNRRVVDNRLSSPIESAVATAVRLLNRRNRKANLVWNTRGKKVTMAVNRKATTAGNWKVMIDAGKSNGRSRSPNRMGGFRLRRCFRDSCCRHLRHETHHRRRESRHHLHDLHRRLRDHRGRRSTAQP